VGDLWGRDFIYIHILNEMRGVQLQVFVCEQVRKNHVVPFGIPLVSFRYPGGSQVVPFWFRLVSQWYPGCSFFLQCCR